MAPTKHHLKKIMKTKHDPLLAVRAHHTQITEYFNKKKIPLRVYIRDYIYLVMFVVLCILSVPKVVCH